MGRYEEADALRPYEPEEPKSKTHEVLLGIRSEVTPDGDGASVAVQFSNQSPFRVHVPLLQAATIMNELRHAASQMLARQKCKLDGGASKILEMCEKARRPAQIQILVDPTTHDRIFIFEFANEAPYTIRVPPDELPIMLAQLARAIARSVN